MWFFFLVLRVSLITEKILSKYISFLHFLILTHRNEFRKKKNIPIIEVTIPILEEI